MGASWYEGDITTRLITLAAEYEQDFTEYDSLQDEFD